MNRRSGYGDDPWNGAIQGLNFLGNAMRTGQQIGETRYQQDERDGENKAFEYIAGKLGSTGDLSALDADPILNTRHGTMAMGKFMLNRANTEQSRLAMLKTMAEADDHFYKNTFRPMASAAQEAFKSGDMQAFGKIASELSTLSPFPYKYEMGQDGNFVELFRSSKEGKFVDTGVRMTPQQVFEQMNGIMSGEQRVLAGVNMQVQNVNPRFLSAASRYRMGTILDNANNLADPKKWIPLTQNGHTVYAIPQNRHDDYSAPTSYRIMDEKGGRSGMVKSMDELLSQGYVHAGAKASIENAQRIAAGRSVGGGGGNADSAGMPFKVSASDMKLIHDMSKTKDIDGNERINPYIGMALQVLMGKNGLSFYPALSAFQENVKDIQEQLRKEKPDISPEQAQGIAQQYYCDMLMGGQKAQGNDVKPTPQKKVGGTLQNTIQEIVNQQGFSPPVQTKASLGPEEQHQRMVEGGAAAMRAAPGAVRDFGNWWWNSMKNNGAQ